MPCRLYVYKNSKDFFNKTASWPQCVKDGFVRRKTGLNPFYNSSWKKVAKASLPILGSIMGFARIYSVLSTKRSIYESHYLRIGHTLIGFIELLGLGSIFFAIIIVFIIFQILYIIFDTWCFTPLGNALTRYFWSGKSFIKNFSHRM
ncbi:hypothetical protein [Chlamydia sp. 17-3921]|uniref:hypothetical protein n=1 Tax=Chlamydia sp. 17-3921 TaxID=2675798 RepID=UPI00191B05F0|nr:hypothetical protein [Chlamydia sp. 17-3921]